MSMLVVGKQYKTEHLVGVAVLLGLFVPHTSIMLMAINPILLVLLWIFTKGKTGNVFNEWRFLICALIVGSTMVSAIFFSHSSYKYIFAALNLFLLILCFPFVGRERVSGGYYLAALLITLFSQLVYVFNIPMIQRLIEVIYPIGEDDLHYHEYMIDNISSSNILQFRLGGVFRNANQGARYICLIMAAFLADRPNEKIRGVLLYILLAASSIVLTGSRTGLVVFSLLVIVYILRNNAINKSIKVCLVLAGILFVLPMFFGGGTARGFNVRQGFNDSANIKWFAFMDYLRQDNSIFHLLFGYGDTQLFHASHYGILPILDSEYGDLIFTYGFVGFLLVVIFYYKVYKMISKNSRFFLLILLWSLTSTILLSYKMSFLFMIFLSHFICDVKSEK